MGSYQVRLRQRVWSVLLFLYILVSLPFAMILLVMLLSGDFGPAGSVFTTLFLLVAVYGAAVCYKLACRNADVLLYPDRAEFIAEGIGILGRPLNFTVYFSEVIRCVDRVFTDRDGLEYCAVLLTLRNGRKYNIDADLAAFRKIKDYSKMNFRRDFLNMFVNSDAFKGSKAKVESERKGKRTSQLIIDLSDAVEIISSFTA